MTVLRQVPYVLRMTLDDVLDLLRRECRSAGSQTAWARAHGVTLAYVNDVLVGRRKPGESILRGLGVEKVVSYRRACGLDEETRND